MFSLRDKQKLLQGIESERAKIRKAIILQEKEEKLLNIFLIIGYF